MRFSVFISFVLFYVNILLTLKILVVTVPLDQVIQVKEIKKHDEKLNTDPLIQDERKNSIHFIQNKNNLSQIKKIKHEPIDFEFFRGGYDPDDYDDRDMKRRNVSLVKYEIQKNFLQVKDRDDIFEDYYTLPLYENNFRWSLTFLMGSNKIPMKLIISTNTPHTILFCKHGNSETSVYGDRKYDISSSNNLFLHSCDSSKCSAIQRSKRCISLSKHLFYLKKFKIRSNPCSYRFCNSVTSLNFIQLRGPFDDKQIDICGFSMSLGNDIVKGFFFQDDFYIKENIRNFYHYFGCITTEENLLLDSEVSGIIGFREYDEETKKKFPTLHEALMLQAKSHKDIFGLCLKERGGFISFGGVRADSIKQKNLLDRINRSFSLDMYDILWLNLVDPEKRFYELKVESIHLKIRDKPSILDIDFKRRMILDSYQYFILLPPDIGLQIKNKITEQCQLLSANECRRLDLDGTFKIGSGDVTEYPKIELKFEEGIVVIEPADYIIRTEYGYYRVMIGPSSVPQLGIPFFLNKYVIFDSRLGRIGVSKSDCSFVSRNDDYTGVADIYAGVEPETNDNSGMIHGLSGRNPAFLIGSTIFLSLCGIVFILTFCFI